MEYEDDSAAQDIQEFKSDPVNSYEYDPGARYDADFNESFKNGMMMLGLMNFANKIFFVVENLIMIQINTPHLHQHPIQNAHTYALTIQMVVT